MRHPCDGVAELRRFRHSISGISAATPFPSFKNLFNGSVQQKQDSKAAMILSLSMLELCLIIAANNVIVNGIVTSASLSRCVWSGQVHSPTRCGES